MPSEADAIRRDALLAELDYFEAQVLRVTNSLNRIAGAHPGVTLLRTIPGVGARTAEAIVAYVDNPKRFRRNRTIGSYFGLVPCQDQSAGRNHLGHITRTGPATARKLLIEAAWQSVRRCEDSRTYFNRLMRGDPDRKKIAVVATAHRLLRVMLAMLQSGEACRWGKIAA
jgi:transposase